MNTKLLGVVATAILFVTPAYSMTVDPSYTIVDLGTLPNGPSSYSTGINASGEVTGFAQNSAGLQAFLYSGKKMIILGTLGGTDSAGFGINNRGEVTGFARNGADLPHAFLYKGKTMLDLGVLPGANAQSAGSVGYAINGRGEVAGASDSSIGTPHAFLYNGTTMIDLGTFGGTNSVGGGTNSVGGGTNSVGLGINNRGEVTGVASTTGNASSQAFLYNGKTMINLGTLGGTDSVGEAINARGEVTGYADTSVYNGTTDGLQHAFLYNGTKMIDLGTLGGEESVGYAINRRGEVVGSSGTAIGKTAAFLYVNDIMFDLNSLISPTDPLNGTVWLNEALGINKSGEIVADGCYTSGSLKCDAFLLKATPPGNTPLPAALPLFAAGLGALGLLGRRRRRKAAAASRSLIKTPDRISETPQLAVLLWGVCCVAANRYGRRPQCKRNLTFLRSVRVQPCIRPVFAWFTSIAMQPHWPLALM
jgi:probable HAF family extracellular repeat protein